MDEMPKGNPVEREEDVARQVAELRDQRNPRVRLQQGSLTILDKYSDHASPSTLVDIGLRLMDTQLSLDMPRISDVLGALVSLRAATNALTLTILEVYQQLAQLELLAEERMLVEPIEQDLMTVKKQLETPKPNERGHS